MAHGRIAKEGISSPGLADALVVNTTSTCVPSVASSRSAGIDNMSAVSPEDEEWWLQDGPAVATEDVDVDDCKSIVESSLIWRQAMRITRDVSRNTGSFQRRLQEVAEAEPPGRLLRDASNELEEHVWRPCESVDLESLPRIALAVDFRSPIRHYDATPACQQPLLPDLAEEGCDTEHGSVDAEQQPSDISGCRDELDGCMGVALLQLDSSWSLPSAEDDQPRQSRSGAAQASGPGVSFEMEGSYELDGQAGLQRQMLELGQSVLKQRPVPLKESESPFSERGAAAWLAANEERESSRCCCTQQGW